MLAQYPGDVARFERCARAPQGVARLGGLGGSRIVLGGTRIPWRTDWRLGRRPGTGSRSKLGREVRRPDGFACAGQGDRPLDLVFELTHVAGPGEPHQERESGRLDAGDVLAVASGRGSEKAVGE